MIGNDIVDLKVAISESNWKRKGFLDKLFCEEEQRTILTNPFPERQLWTFWAMKEATYKAHQRRFGLSRSYNPGFFVCEERNQTSGCVQAGGLTYYTCISKNKDYVHCISSAVPEQKNISRITLRFKGFKEAFLKDCTASLNLPEGLEIKKNEHAVPQLYRKEEILNTAFSFSHHGRYSAYAAAR